MEEIMPKKYITAKYFIATILMAFSLNVCSSVMSQEQQSTEDLERARVTNKMSARQRQSQIFMFHSGFVYIGDLVLPNFWGPVLPLADNQVAMIKSLDSSLWGAKRVSMSDDADYLDTNPRDYKEFMERSERRRKAAVKHGQLMTLAGLLTEPQLNAVLQHFVSGQKANALHDSLIQDVLEFSEAQKTLLAQAQSEYDKNTKPLFLGSMLPNPPDVEADLRRFKQEYLSTSMRVLTSAQKKKYAQLSAKRPLLKSAPEMPVPSESEQKQIDVKELSDVFRAIGHLQNENELTLSEVQKKLLNKLYVVTQRGLFWIKTADASQGGNGAKSGSSGLVRSEAEFLKNAGQVALQGILTEHQAKQVQDVM